MYARASTIEQYDSELSEAINSELQRQEDHIELIASENYASPRVLEAQGSGLTNKYAEGYPGKRYYGGCEYVDLVEDLAIDRAKKLFGAAYANVQPHAGSQANAAAYLALMNAGDTLLGMSLADGGHLTHGASVNFSGKIYNAVQYGIDSDGYMNYNQVADLAEKHKPKLILGGFSAYSRIVDWAKLREIADNVGAYLLVDMAHIAGLVAAGVYPSPIPHAHVVTTTTHKTLRGPRSGLILSGHEDEVLHKKLNSAVFPGMQGGPLMHVIAAKAVAFKEAMEPGFKSYQEQVVKNAKVMASGFVERGFKIISGGTDNHLMLVDLVAQGITGKAADTALGESNITVNKNAVPNDPQSPFVTSGIRIGTPAVTTRGFVEDDCRHLTQLICDVLENLDAESTKGRVREQVKALCDRLPVYR
ncbi:serine hydroxymethyltransferase [Litorivicinus sp.]|jgi:glycine hydroxymethyltransferase|nr:serine hydroxymethyltransferase [Litorivicinus sp.]